MKTKLMMTLALSCTLCMGCRPDAPTPTASNRSGPAVLLSKEIETPEIIRILEKESITFVSTTHGQEIGITLEDGRAYHGKYVFAQAGQYSHITDVLNLVSHIGRQRPAEEFKKWLIRCE